MIVITRRVKGVSEDGRDEKGDGESMIISSGVADHWMNRSRL